MDNGQLLLNLYKEQQYDVTHERLQRAFTGINVISGAFGVAITLIFYTDWLYVFLFLGIITSVAFNMALVRLKRIRIDMASSLTMLYNAFIFVPALWKAFIVRIDKAMEESCQMNIPISSSYGFAARTECKSPEAVLKLADERLYENKQAKKAAR